VHILNIAVPGNAQTVNLEEEFAEGITTTTQAPPAKSGLEVAGQTITQQTPGFGGMIWLRNTGAVNILIGDGTNAPVWPLDTTDAPLGPIHLSPDDQITAKIASGSAAGQVTVWSSPKE
jgi:hypothetical protein